MADFQGPIPFTLVDPTDPTKKQIVDSNGAAKVTGDLTITGGTEIISGTNTWSIDSNGSGSVTIANASIAVTATDLDIRSLTAATDTVSIADGSNGLTIDSNGAIPISGIASTVTVGGSVSVTNTVTVSATDFDIRNLDSNSDSVAVTGTVAVSSIASTVTVGATDFDIRNLTVATDAVAIGSGSNILAVDSNGAVAVSAIAGTVTISGNTAVTNTVTVSATDLDIRGLAAATDTVSIGSGANTLAIDSNGAISVVVAPTASTLVSPFGASTNDVAKDASFTFDYVVTSGKTFTGIDVLAASSTAVKVQIGTWNGSAFTTKRVYFQQPKLNEAKPIEALTLTGNGTLAVRVIITNLDAATTLYCSINGKEA